MLSVLNCWSSWLFLDVCYYKQHCHKHPCREIFEGAANFAIVCVYVCLLPAQSVRLSRAGSLSDSLTWLLAHCRYAVIFELHCISRGRALGWGNGMVGSSGRSPPSLLKHSGFYVPLPTLLGLPSSPRSKTFPSPGPEAILESHGNASLYLLPSWANQTVPPPARTPILTHLSSFVVSSSWRPSQQRPVSCSLLLKPWYGSPLSGPCFWQHSPLDLRSPHMVHFSLTPALLATSYGTKEPLSLSPGGSSQMLSFFLKRDL